MKHNSNKAEEILKDLLELSRFQGYLNYRDILQYLPEQDEDLLAQVLESLSEENIDIAYEEDEKFDDSSNRSDYQNHMLNDDKLQLLLSDKKLSLPRSINSVKSYMNEMGKVPLLNRQEEIRLSKIIENASLQLTDYYTRYPHLIGFIIKSYQDLKRLAETQLNTNANQHPNQKAPPLCDVIKFNKILHSYVSSTTGEYLKINIPVSAFGEEKEKNVQDQEEISDDKFNNFIESRKLFDTFENLVELYQQYCSTDRFFYIEAIREILKGFKMSCSLLDDLRRKLQNTIAELRDGDKICLNVLLEDYALPRDKAAELIKHYQITDSFLSSLPSQPEALLQLKHALEIKKKIEKQCLISSECLRQDFIYISKLLKSSETAKETMIRSNLRLVISCAKKHIRRRVKLQFLDLVQAGNSGLMRAVEKFDYRMGYKFSTYATWWIRQSITRSMADQGKLIRVPVHVIETLSRYRKTVSNEEEHVPENVKEKIQKIINISKDPLSTDVKLGDESSTDLSDVMADVAVQSPLDSATCYNLHEVIIQVLNTLQPREAEVLKMRFGIDTDMDHTLEEVGKRFNVTRERIRQIEYKALRKLRKSVHFSVLEDFLNLEAD